MSEEMLPEDRFQFKPFLGIRPGVYLALLYSLVILLVLFFILVYPGLSKPGDLWTFYSEPWGAAVRVDGVYMLSAPDTVFIPRGHHEVEMVLPGFNPFQAEIDSRGRLFGSLIFPRRATLGGTLETPDPLEALRLGAADFAAWSFTGEPVTVYQIPRSLSEGAYRAGPAAANSKERAAMGEILTAAARFTQTRAGLRELARAKTLTDSAGLAASPLSLLISAGETLAWLSAVPGAASWLAETLAPETANQIRSSSWYNQNAASLPVGGPLPAPGNRVSLSSASFREIPGGTFVQGTIVKQAVSLDGFYIAEREISAALWENFTKETPRWRAEEAPSLMEQELVDSGYLAGEGGPRGSISGVSWYAAQAFCRWFSAALPPDLEGWELRLPTEAEWEYAALVLREAETGDAIGGSLVGKTGYWEWCVDPFAPLDFLPAPARAIQGLGSPERSLRGASWVNPPDSVGFEIRASLSPASCSPFVSFRPIIARTAGALNTKVR